MLRNMYNNNLLMYSYFKGHNFTINIENRNHFTKSVSINYNWVAAAWYNHSKSIFGTFGR